MYAIGVRVKVALGIVHTDGRYNLSNCMAPLRTYTWDRCTGPAAHQACCRCDLLHTVH